MKNIPFFAIIPLLLLLGCSTSSENENYDNRDYSLDSPNWTLSFSDEFDGSAGIPDTGKWERQEYNRRPNSLGPDGWWELDNSRIDGNGHLDLSISKTVNRNPSEDSDTQDYNVGMIRSKGQFSQTYGKFEARLKLPAKSGWWVAFWLFPDNGTGSDAQADGSGEDGTEIDIMEGFGNGQSRIQSALHYDGYGDNHRSTGQEYTLNDTEAFHIYTLIWTETKYEVYIDGEKVWTFTGSFTKDGVTYNPGICSVPCYVKLTGELSTESWALADSWAGPLPADDFETADHFLVDWVRVYRYQD